MPYGRAAPWLTHCHPEPAPSLHGTTGDDRRESRRSPSGGICFILAHDLSGSCFVCILASRSRTLYIGVTNNLERRLAMHRGGFVPGFTSRYRVFRLVHFEAFADVRPAIAREKEIKSWLREKKIWLIERHNRTWEDLAKHLAAGT